MKPTSLSENTNQTEELIESILNEIKLDESLFPVFKINDKGKILYANNASFDLLRDWATDYSEYLPENFLKSNADLLNYNAEFSIALETKNGIKYFDVIGFKECGYIGLYGYQNEFIEQRELLSV